MTLPQPTFPPQKTLAPDNAGELPQIFTRSTESQNPAPSAAPRDFTVRPNETVHDFTIELR